METFDRFKKVFICGSKSCNKYLEKPVTLPCGFTICQEHIKSNDDDLENEYVTFKCVVCEDEHTVSKFLAINQLVSELIENDVHLSQEQKELKANITKLEDFLLDRMKDSPEEHICVYFSNLKNKIDSHRKKSIQSIHKRSDELIKELSETEQRFKDNLKSNLKVPEFETEKIEKYKETLRNPNVNLSEVSEMVEKLKSSVLDFQYEIKMFKSSLTMNKIVSFEPNNCINSFGKLDTKLDKNRSEATFQLVLNEFSKFKESKQERRSQRTCFVGNAPWKIEAQSTQLDDGHFDLGLHLICNKKISPYVDWSISVQYELRILHLTNLQKNVAESIAFS
jgi:hypothetical protein